jgi:hypothetical protein
MSKNKKTARFDLNDITYLWEDKQGFLRGDGYLTRIGVFTYMNADGTLRKELRHPKDVYDSRSLSTMKMIPVTDGHPDVLVDKNNAQTLQKGFVGEEIRPHGDHVAAPVVITVSDLIDKVDNGKIQLSLGYETTVIEEVGVYDGIQYDYRQTEIEYNHLAVVDMGRAGEKASLKTDSVPGLREGDAIMVKADEDKNKEDSNNSKVKEAEMPKYNVDGIQYEASQEVINRCEKYRNDLEDTQAKFDSATQENAEFKKKVDTIEAERDDYKKKFDDLQNKDRSDEINKAAEARLKVFDVAGKVFTADDDIKYKEMKNDEIIRAVVQKDDPDFKIDEYKDRPEYIQARFDIIAKNLHTKGISSQREDVFGNIPVPGNPKSSDDARNDMIDNMKDNWQKKDD